MRKLIVLLAAVAVLTTAGLARAQAVDQYDDSQSHPLRLLAYIIHPIGYTLEWLVTRPFHQFVAQPDLGPVFGHTPHGYYGDPQVDTTLSDRATWQRAF